MLKASVWIVAAITVLSIIFVPIHIEAKSSRSSSGSRSYSRPSTPSRSSSKPSYSKPSSNSGSSSNKKTYSSGNLKSSSSSSLPTERYESKAAAASAYKASQTKYLAQKSKYDAAKKSGTAFSSKSAAISDFKSKHGSLYGSKYSSKPATRPSHIPSTTSSGGTTYNVNYNSQYGGYGYMSGGRWIMYDAMADVAMISILMSNRGYYYGGAPIAPVQGNYVVQSGGLGFLSILLIVLGVGIVFFIIVAVAREA